MIILRILLALIALALIAVGLVVMVAPTPFGFILVAIGLLLLAVAAPGIMRALRKKWRWLDRRLDDLTEHLPNWIARRLKDSDPEDEHESDEPQNR